MNAKRWTRDELQAAVDAGMNQAQIGREMGVDQSTVSYHMKRHGVTPMRPQPGTPRPTREELQAAVDAGKTQVQIAADLGVHPYSVGNWMNRYDITPARPNLLAFKRSRLAASG